MLLNLLQANNYEDACLYSDIGELLNLPDDWDDDWCYADKARPNAQPSKQALA